ncbi:unnamed protein product [Candidula unifasciata]|uniref:BHLH domain-containing protein n=1 Tax=Candidula unifasciata TaxID=100452 RepID=A0A8S4A660_9EUPU|nr:unnamed protein product [Candidula unifasciata]
MIAVGADFLEPEPNSSTANFQVAPVGNELPSLNCDFGDLLLPSELDQLLMQNFCDIALSSESFMHWDLSMPDSEHSVPLQPANDLPSFLYENTPNSRDLNLLFLEKSLAPHGPPVPGVITGDLTPPHPGGLTPTNMSRSTSPAWSESSGSMSASSVSGGTLKENLAARRSNPLPRHKRPAHKRAEIKRRDKIKTSLDDIKEYVPSLRDKGKLSESAILSKAAEYVHLLKDEHLERGSKVAELRREIECLSSEIHGFQDNLPAAGLREEACVAPTLDEMYRTWATEESQKSTKFFIFSSITSRLFGTFKEVVGPATSLNGLFSRAQEWQSKYLALPVIRKQILSGMLDLCRQSNIVISSDNLKVEFGSSTDNFQRESIS